jgi:hypothetical protein
MSFLQTVLYDFLLQFRWLGIIAIALVAMAVLITEGAREKLSPTKLLTVTASGVLAAVLFWTLPTVIDYARSDADLIIPAPVGGLYR